MFDDTQDLTIEAIVPADWRYPAELEPQTQAPQRIRVSVWATLGLVVSVVGLCAVLTGLLVPVGFGLGAVGTLLSLAGVADTARPYVNGLGVALLGLLFGVGALALAMLVSAGEVRWLAAGTDEVARWHTWLVAHWPWLHRFEPTAVTVPARCG
jgi:hypothetical protein